MKTIVSLKLGLARLIAIIFCISCGTSEDSQTETWRTAPSKCPDHKLQTDYWRSFSLEETFSVELKWETGGFFGWAGGLCKAQKNLNNKLILNLTNEQAASLSCEIQDGFCVYKTNCETFIDLKCEKFGDEDCARSFVHEKDFRRCSDISIEFLPDGTLVETFVLPRR